MCRLRNIAMHDYQLSVTNGQTDRWTDTGQSDPYVPLCFPGDTRVVRRQGEATKLKQQHLVSVQVQGH